jgi:tetratricopeptide (TPR) repeat protein
LHKAAGRLAVQLKRFLAAEEHQSKVVAQISNDGEALYYLGNAYWFLGKRRDARIAWESAALLPAFRPAALLQLARLASQEGKLQQALAEVHRALVDSPRLLRAGCMEVTLLRHLGKGEEAKTRLAYWQTIDPPNSFLRVENGHWKGEEESLWRHLAGDPERVLEIAVEYLKLGFYQDTVELLARQYPQEGVQAEPGAVLPQHYPLVAYYRGYCREKLGAAGKEDFQLARQMSTRFVFPNRSETMAVLELALKSNPADGVAHFLLGSLYLSGGMAEEAIQEWEKVRQLNPGMPVLHRNLGYATLFARRDAARALELFQEGIKADPSNVENFFGVDQAMSLLGKKPEERAAFLKQFPGATAQPPALSLKLALALAENGQFEEAQKLLSRGYFPREEFGTNVRQVYLEVLLQKALWLARQGKRQEALGIAASIGNPVSGISFTADGLEAFLRPARFRYYLGNLNDLCGRPDLARKHWQDASQSREPRQAPFAFLAAKRLGAMDSTAWEKRLGSALEDVKDYIAGGGHFPGPATFSQGMILELLGRREESAEQLRQVFYLPDKGMSHYLARQALRTEPKEGF